MMSRPTRWFVLAVLFQVMVLAGVPAQKYRALLTGKTVRLRTAPVDPYSLLSGYYVTLSYEISTPGNLPSETGFDRTLYVTLEEGKDGVWDVQQVSLTWPENLSPAEVVIKGTQQRRAIIYGIETYFIPEDSRQEIGQVLIRNPRGAIMDVKVDSAGHAAITALTVEGKKYEF